MLRDVILHQTIEKKNAAIIKEQNILFTRLLFKK